MISFRFHIVSLAGVFMALALGIVLGTAFINDATIESVETASKRYRAERDAAQDELREWKRFGEHSEDAVVAGMLDGVRVLTIVPEGLQGSVVDKLHSLLGRAGAIDAGRIIVGRAWADVPPATDTIADALGIVGPNSISSVTDAAAQRLAREFATGGGATLPALVEANLLRLETGDPATTPGESPRFLVIDDGPPTGLLEPLTRALARELPSSVLVADAETGERAEESLVAILRRDAEGLLFSTVDHFDTPPGRIAAILALRDFARGNVGDYGSAAGNDRAAPPGG